METQDAERQSVTSRIEGILDRASDVYSGSILARATALALAGPLGPAIDLMLTSRGARFIEKRFEAFAQQVNETTDRIGEEKLDKAYIESEEFLDVLTRALREASSTRHRDRIILYARILVGSTSVDRPGEVDPEDLFQLIAGLSPAQIGIARTMYAISADSSKTLKGPIPPPTGPHMEFNLLQLVNAGLLDPAADPNPPFGTSGYYITSAFHELVRFLTDSTGAGL